jgi:hypothetical protein
VARYRLVANRMPGLAEHAERIECCNRIGRPIVGQGCGSKRHLAHDCRDNDQQAYKARAMPELTGQQARQRWKASMIPNSGNAERSQVAKQAGRALALPFMPTRAMARSRLPHFGTIVSAYAVRMPWMKNSQPPSITRKPQ